MTTRYLMPDGTWIEEQHQDASQGQGWLSGMEQMGLMGLFGPSALGAPLGSRYSTEAYPDSEGWFQYTEKMPPSGILCQFKQGRDGNPFVCFPDFNELFNAADLYWRLTGIGKQQLESR